MRNISDYTIKLLRETLGYIKELEYHLYLLSLNILSGEIDQAKKLAKKSILLLKENGIEKILTDLKEEIEQRIKEKMEERTKENKNLTK
ncbi:MAG: hypothetical protein ACP5HC_02025 [Caldisericum sp.]